jgi:hypothetical protein
VTVQIDVGLVLCFLSPGSTAENGLRVTSLGKALPLGKERASSDAGRVADGDVVGEYVVGEYVVAAEVIGFPSTLYSIVIAMPADTVRQK